MRSFSEHIEILEFENELLQLNEDSRQVQKAHKTLKSFAKTLADKGWEVGEIKENDPDDYGQLLTMSARKDKYPEPSDFRDSSMVLISVDVRFRQTRGQRASSSISTSVYQKQKWQKVSMRTFWEYVNAVENEKEFKDRKIKELQTAHRKGRISDEDFADSMKLYEERALLEVGDSLYPWKWTKWEKEKATNRDGDSLTVTAHTDNDEIKLKIVSAGYQKLYVDFEKYSKTKGRMTFMKTGEGDAFKTLSTIQNMLFEFIKEYKKRYGQIDFREMLFTVEKEDENEVDASSRARLYKRWGETFARKIGAKLVINREGNTLDYSFIFPEPGKEDSLTEAFDKPYPIRWREEKGRMGGQVVTGIFKTDEGTIYEIKFVIWEQDGELMGNVEFRQPRAQSQGKLPAGILGTGDQFRVFATVIDGIKYVIGQAELASLTFDADKDLPSRVKLYNRMVKKLGDEIGYKSKIDDTSDEDAVLYTLLKESTLTEERSSYLKVTFTDKGKTRNIYLKNPQSSTNTITGIEVNKYGDEIKPKGAHQRKHIIDKNAIKKSIEVTMDKTYGELNEAFEKPYPWEWQDFDVLRQGSFLQASARTDPGHPTQIWVSFADNEPGEVEVEFSRKTKDDQWRADKVGEGDAFRIFATVIDVIKDFIKEYPKKVGIPLKQLSFSADKPSKFLSKRAGSNPESRAKLYARMVKRFASSVRATASIEDTQSKTYYDLKFK